MDMIISILKMTEIISSEQKIASELIPGKPKIIRYSLMIKTTYTKLNNITYVKIGSVTINRLSKKIVKIMISDSSCNMDGYINMIMKDLDDNYNIAISSEKEKCSIL